ncbi:MAG: DUF721 domain-containing protein [Acidobacteria bacterium]|nr:DUF721 domain-containing protein [Acidobacteriota bacterium]
MEALAGILEHLIRTKGPPPEEFYAAVLPALWRRVVGVKLFEVTRPGPLLKGRLTVLVRGAAWKRNLAGMEPVFRERLEAFLPPGTVRDILFRSMPGRFAEPPAGAPPALPEEDLLWAGRCAAAIRNEALREVFLRALKARMALDLETAAAGRAPDEQDRAAGEKPAAPQETPCDST